MTMTSFLYWPHCYNSISEPSKQQMFRNLLINNSFKRLSNSPIKSAIFKRQFALNNFSRVNRTNFTKPSFIKSTPLIFGSSLTLYLLNLKNPIKNDVTTRNPINIDFQRKLSRFNNKLNYEELTIGSISGLFLGIIAGKLSSIIVILTLGSYFLLQYLESRNIISIPWNKLLNLGYTDVDVKKLVFEKISFKISFVLTFLIAAFNV